MNHQIKSLLLCVNLVTLYKRIDFYLQEEQTTDVVIEPDAGVEVVRRHPHDQVARVDEIIDAEGDLESGRHVHRVHRRLLTRFDDAAAVD